jgi:uncharacterized membrane protein
MNLLALLAAYILFFSSLHSLTAAKFFKKQAYSFIEPGTYRFIYTLVSGVTVLPILYLWYIGRTIYPPLYIVSFPFSLLAYAVMAAGLYLVLKSLILIDPLEFIGFKAFLKIKSVAKTSGLITSGVYSITRHPLYLGGIMILWSNLEMSLPDLLVSTLFTLYFIAGGVLEERKLVEEFGDVYRRYKEEVSMILPVKWILGFIRG